MILHGRWLASLALFLLSLVVVECRLPGQELRPRWEAPPLERSISARDGHTDTILTFDQLLDALATADVVFLGETHTDETTHRVELAVYEGLLIRRQGFVALALEMFERDVQPSLNAYLKGEIGEVELLKQSRPWENYRAAYRPLIERAKQSHAPVLASNFPRSLRSQLATEGPQVLQSLAGDAKQHAPAQLLAQTDSYWRRVDNAIRGHAGMIADGDRLHSAQSLWDNAMGDSCAVALDKYPGSSVLHVNGDFHSTYWEGAVHQLRQRKPNARIKTVSIVPVANPAVAELRGAPSADFVIFAEARASDRSEGSHSVYAQREVKYKLHIPADASRTDRVPLLIWLVDDGLTASDGMDLWESRLGQTAAIAAIEPPYREMQEDLGIGGRWYWADSFSSDVSTAVEAVERIWGYVARHYSIDPARVCVAGEGTGATVAAAVALLTDRMDVHGLASGPRQYGKLKDFPLPLPEAWGNETPPRRSLTVVGDPADESWWSSELKGYREVGLSAEMVRIASDPWQREPQLEEGVRQGLGLKPSAVPIATQRRYLLLELDAPRARQWARLQALWSAERDGVMPAVVPAPPDDSSVTRIALEIRPENFAATDALPRCPGPFGGTTVVVLPPDATEQQQRDWDALAESDPLTKQSRFHRMRVARSTGERSLVDVLAKLQSENRKNVLIVPAAFFADPAWLRSLQRSVRSLGDQMTLQWLPGLGGRKSALANQPDPVAEPPLRHELEVALQPDQHRIVVEDRIQLPASLRRAGVEFALNPALKITASNPAVKLVEQGELQGKGTNVSRYALEQIPADGVLSLTYEGTMDFGLSDQKEEYTRGFRQTRGVVGQEGVYLDEESDWVPRFDDRLIRFAMQVRLPAEWQVISQGRGIARDAEGWAQWEAEGPMDQIYLVGGPLHRETDSAGAVEVQVYLHEPDEGLSRKYLDTAARYLEMYRELIGPYPYSKFALVENFWETGYGMPSFTLLGPQVIRFPFILHSSYPHEILHNWWGNSVFVNYEQGNWCEGLTAYLADHLIQEQRGLGAEYRRNTLQKYRDYVREGRDFPLAEFRSRHSAATEAVGYGKALMLFHMLRLQLGDDAFRAGLASFYRQHRGQRAGFDDLRAAFATSAATELGPYFAQWVGRRGAPHLALRDVSVEPRAGEYVVTGTLDQIQLDDPFMLEVPVTVHTAAGTVSTVVQTSARRKALEIRVPQRPVLLSVDPMFDVFRQLDPRETPTTIGQIFGQPRILAVLSSHIEDAADSVGDSAGYKELIAAWQSDEHAIDVVLDRDLKSLPDDRAVWILGRKNRFANELFAKEAGIVRVDDAAVELAGERVSLADHSIVAVRRHPRQVDQVVGWLVVAPREAFAGMARKLPHYGKYSYLAFEGSEPTNTVKGQWDTSGSPLVVDLREQRAEPQAAVAIEPRRALAELPPVFSSRELAAHVEWLAAPEREGRGLGTSGIAQSAEYIAQAMAAAGLQPGGDDGTWYQTFTVARGPQGTPVEAANVVGILPGKRADWRDQSVVLSAHYDHLGRGWPDVHAGDEGRIHPGADDNASGVAVMLELARMIAAEGGGPRNLVVVAFSAEEAGRLGSRHYVSHPHYPLQEVRGVINLDAVGRLRDQPLLFLGTGTADEWQHIFRGCTFVTGIPSKNVPEAAGGSDQLSFIEQGVPAVQVFTGAHGDYHRPTDTPDKIDAAGLVKVATFVKEAMSYFLEREPPLTVRLGGAAPPPPAAVADGGRKVLFGAVPAFDYQGEGVKFESLVPDSPAARAGLRAGDILRRVNDERIADLRAFANVLRQLEPDQQVTATVLRDGKELTVNVTLTNR